MTTAIPKKIIDYNIIGGYTCMELEQKVILFLKEGWQPLGHPFVDTGRVFQTMVKYELPSEGM